MSKTYFEKLKDPRWQKRRLEIMQKAKFACEKCGDEDAPLHIHHRIYRKGKQPWEYSDDELECLYEVCHMDAEHDRDTVAEAMADPRVASFLIPAAAEMLNDGPLANVLQNLKKIMLEGMHNFVPTSPVRASQKDSGIKRVEMRQQQAAELADELQSFLAEMRAKWEALATEQ